MYTILYMLSYYDYQLDAVAQKEIVFLLKPIFDCMNSVLA